MFNPTRKHAPFIILTGMLAISSASILIKLCDATAMVIAVYRVGVASLLYLGLAKSVGKTISLPKSRQDALLTLASGAFLAFHFATWTTSLNYTTVASSVVLVQTFPIFVTIGAAIIFKEKPGPVAAVGMVVAMGGGAIIALYDSRFQASSVLGNGLALLGALGASGYFLIGRQLRKTMNTLSYSVLVYGSAAVMLLIYILFTGPMQLVNYNLTALGLLLAIAILPQAIGHTSFNWALKYFTAATVSIMTLAESIGSSILAWLLLGEALPLYKITGGIILLSGVVTVLLNEKSHKIPETLQHPENRI